MSICVKGLNAEIYQHIRVECPRMFISSNGAGEDVVDVYLNDYAILKTSLEEVKIELGLHTYYLVATDFLKVEIC